MENKPPKTDQTPNRFRVARNVQPTPDGRLIPRYDVAEIAGQASNKRYIHHMTQYDNSLLSIASDDTNRDYGLNAYLDNTLIPSHHDNASLYSYGNCMGNTKIDTTFNDQDSPYSIMSYRINNTVYFCNPYSGHMFKYDGVEMSAMGCHQPMVSTASYVAAGIKFIRAIQHCIDFDNNEPVSEYVQIPTNTVGNITFQMSGSSFTQPIGKQNVRPDIVRQGIGGTYPPFYASTSATYVGTAGDEHFTFAGLTTNITKDSQVGSYVFVTFSYQTTLTTGIPESLGIALRVRSVNPLTLSAKSPKYLSLERKWETSFFNLNSTMSSSIANGSRSLVSFWGSEYADGVYVFRGIGFSFPDPTIFPGVSVTSIVNFSSYTVANTTGSGRDVASNYLVTISPILGDWYSEDIIKVSPNSLTFKGTTEFELNWDGLTSYSGVLVLFNKDTINWSDTALAGSFDQLNFNSSAVIGKAEDGQIISACGASDFMAISRLRKNYFLNGDITTGNVRVQEVPSLEIGAWSNNATKVIKDSILCATAMGIYIISGGGRAEILSATIPKNFSTFDNYANDEDVVFTLIGTNAVDTSPGNDYGISITYDQYRELIFIMRKGKHFEDNPILVLHTKTGEFYEWNGLLSGNGMYATDICAINGEVYVAGYFPELNTLGAKVYKEDKESEISYPESYPIKLYSTWVTAGEPSLEKQVLQLKMFGEITESNDKSIRVVHFKDWDNSTKITDVQYEVGASNYSHKQRLNSDKVLAVSCGIEVVNAGVTFELESMELEFNGIQQGMKR